MDKLIRILRILSPKEFSQLTDFIHSPFFCQHKQTIVFFDFLAPYYPEFNFEIRTELALAHYPGGLSKAHFNLLKTYLLRQVYSFLTHQKLKNSPLLEKELLIEDLQRREFYSDAKHKLDAAQSILNADTCLDSDQYGHRLKLKELELNHHFSQQMRQGIAPVIELFDTMDQFNLGIGLKYLLPAISFSRMLGEPFPTARWETYKAQIGRDVSVLPPLTQMHYHLICLIEGGNNQQLPALNDLLDQYEAQMSREECMNALGNLQNYLTKRQAEGDPQALQMKFELYKRMDRNKLLFGNGEFTEHLVRNIVIAGCRLQEFEWTRQFLESNAEAIEESVGLNVTNYSWAFFYFYTGKYPEALQLLQKLKFSDQFYRTGHQALLLRIYYELRDHESLNALGQTFRRYLNRTKSISEKQKGLNRRFISALRMLSKAQEYGLTPARKEKIEELLAAPNPITDRTWLQSKFDELISS